MELVPSSSSGWRTAAPPSLTRNQHYWLFRPGALTGGLRRLGHVDLRVLEERPSPLKPSEAWMLARPAGTPVWLREIVMSIDGTHSVFARSFTPLAASHGMWQGMRRLRSRPLADMLYHDPEITRSRFFVSRLAPAHPMYRSIRRFMGDRCPPPGAMFARCSVFWRREEPLLVAECFLPEFWGLAARSARGQGLAMNCI